MQYGYSAGFHPVTPCVKFLVLANVIIWIVLVLGLQGFLLDSAAVFKTLGLVPYKVGSDFFVWQFVTYMFIHGNAIMHIVFNMLMLWMFGSELELLWRRKFFLTYYFVCGVGSALVYFAIVKIYILIASSDGVSGSFAVDYTPVVGSSGAIFGLLLAYGLVFGDRVVLFMLIFPMKARTLVIILAGVELVTLLNTGFGNQVANLAHLGGLVTGFVFLKFRGFIHKIRQKKRWSNATSPHFTVLSGGRGNSYDEEEDD